MKRTLLATGVILLAVVLCQADVRYFKIDTLEQCNGVDLETGSTSPLEDCLLRDDRQPASEFQDFAFGGYGLLWCDCDKNAYVAYNEAYRVQVPLDSLAGKEAADLADTDLFQPIPVNYQGFRNLEQATDSIEGYYILKSDQGNYALFGIISHYYVSTIICDHRPRWCLYRI